MSSWDKFRVSPEEFVKRHGVPVEEINMSEQDPRNMGTPVQNNMGSNTMPRSAQQQRLAFYDTQKREVISISPEGIKIDPSVPMDELVKLFVAQVNAHFQKGK